MCEHSVAWPTHEQVASGPTGVSGEEKCSVSLPKVIHIISLKTCQNVGVYQYIRKEAAMAWHATATTAAATATATTARHAAASAAARHAAYAMTEHHQHEKKKHVYRSSTVSNVCVCVFFSQKMCNSQVIWKLKGHGYYNMPLTWLRAFIFVLFSRLCVDDVFGPRTPNCSFMFFHVLSLCDIVMSHTCSPFPAKLGWVRERSWLGITNCPFTIPGTWGETRMSCRQRFKTR